jgi:hypothetical protein
MAEVAHHNVEGNACIDEVGRGGVPEAMCLADLNGSAGGVGDRQFLGKLFEAQVHGGHGVGGVAAAVDPRAHEQVPGLGFRRAHGGHEVAGHLLLRLDDRDDLGIDGNGIGHV